MAENVYKASIVHSTTFGKIDCHENAYLGLNKDGKIIFLASDDDQLELAKEMFPFENQQVHDLGDRILMPGFVDTHFHAPQYTIAGENNYYMAENVYKASIVHSTTFGKIDCHENAYLGLNKDGKIIFLASDDDQLELAKEMFPFENQQVHDLGDRILMPGFVDTHFHAPQYTIAGNGTGMPLLDWLDTYTFPTESKFKEIEFASKVYPKAVERSLKNGTTTCSYFGTIHLESTKFLADQMNQLGQRGFVGKVNMDQNSPEFYLEATNDSLKDTELFIEHCLGFENSNVQPIITPRFAITCSSVLMKSLGDLAEKYDLPIQSHVSENKAEVDFVKELFPEYKSYTDVYLQHNLLNSKTIMAHGIYLSQDELKDFENTGAAISHCPVSNFSLQSGHLNVRHSLANNIKIGLGSDVSGGYSSSMLSVMRQTIINSFSMHFTENQSTSLDWREAYWLATVGGSQVMGMENTIGNFEIGKDFDAIVVDPNVKGSPFDLFGYESLEEKVEKFVYLGDDRNVVQVFVQAEKVWDISQDSE
eukprot:TRINITY_DN6317_c0_g2_i1.p1 TRINITY_DN6317_c0_g2~~TRINITY_DN6317_c0_g2_i1.p1  ORF type:complete len:547 (-),score=120.40 TRINITY_DN6317_c0_g2_i1:63-1664(-)